MSKAFSSQISFEPIDNERLANLSGQFDQHLKSIEKSLAVSISNRGEVFKISGLEADVISCKKVLKQLYLDTATSILDNEKIHLALQAVLLLNAESSEIITKVYNHANDEISIHTGRAVIKPRGENQSRYINRILQHDINFGLGPAGTGKTYLAVACAIAALNENQIRRLILTRPAVEAGENLGFLPGDLSQKIDPYLRPLYDALYDMMGFEKVNRLIERHVIEVAPLAFMRGRSLNESFIILDEAQNTTSVQMKMFLTRIGFGSKVIITGDPTQVDLPNKMTPGLSHSLQILKNIKGISFTQFENKDVVRHPIVQRIVNAYDKYEREQQQKNVPSH